MTPWQQHLKSWGNCTKCPLHKTRRKIVLAKGKLPASVVMVGEAPGASEDVIGQPFVGPAGKLLDRIIEMAAEEACFKPSIAFTNLVCCIPKAPDTNRKRGEPLKGEIEACRPRLEQFLGIHSQSIRLLVLVGGLSAKWGGLTSNWGVKCPTLEIVHPSYMLQNKGQQGLLVQQSVVRLGDAFIDLSEKVGVP